MANPETAVTVVDQSPEAVVEWNLDNWPVEQFNRLVPTQTLGLPTDLIRPIIQVVQLDIERDTYESRDLEQGHRAPNARGLALLAAAAGVDFQDEQRVDDGSNPLRASAKVWATIVDGSGRQRTVVGSRDYDLSAQPMTDKQRERAKAYVYENASTRARHRALRVLLGVRQSYPVAELAKPFAVVSYVPNTQHPEIRELYKAALAPAIAASFGPAKQLAAGEAPIDVDAEDVKNVTPAPTPTELPGESIAAARSSDGQVDDLPDWAKPAEPEAASKPKAAKKAEPTLVERLQQSVEASGLQGAMSEPQKARLGELLGSASPLAESWDTDVLPVLRAAFGPSFRPAEISAAQAQAVITLADSFAAAEPVIDFTAEWRAAAGLARKAAAA